MQCNVICQLNVISASLSSKLAEKRFTIAYITPSHVAYCTA